MKLARWLMVGFIMICMIGGSGISQPESDSPVFLKVDYIKVQAKNVSAYLAVERDIWKPVHELRVKNGIITGWYLLSVLYPAGSEVGYNYVIVNVTDNFSHTNRGFNDELFQAAHPSASEKEIDEMLGKTWASRDMVRSELWRRQDMVPRDKPAPYQRINLMLVAPGMDAKYLELEQDIWKPILQTYKKAGYTAGWGLYSLMFPGGTQMSYNYSTVDFFNDYAELSISIPDSINQMAHPKSDELDWEGIQDLTIQVRSLVRQELRVLIDYVNVTSLKSE